mmetsp:Transcript_5691/g.9785  ORF Transcript_5691/g.9785 Transcript_5691/m.9785 type:complete len:81 (-) Transcript_5691:200-442(-)
MAPFVSNQLADLGENILKTALLNSPILDQDLLALHHALDLVEELLCIETSYGHLVDELAVKLPQLVGLGKQVLYEALDVG